VLKSARAVILNPGGVLVKENATPAGRDGGGGGVCVDDVHDYAYCCAFHRMHLPN
jgi:hypothetical protein